jgi:hypothetical protein
LFWIRKRGKRYFINQQKVPNIITEKKNVNNKA